MLSSSSLNPSAYSLPLTDWTTPPPPCRDHGPRAERSKTRLLWLVEALGMERWVGLVEAAMGPGTQLRPRVEVCVCARARVCVSCVAGGCG